MQNVRLQHRKLRVSQAWVCVCVYLVAQSCPPLCVPITATSQAPLHGIFQVRILEWVAISFSRGSSQPRDGTHISWVSCLSRQILYH